MGVCRLAAAVRTLAEDEWGSRCHWMPNRRTPPFGDRRPGGRAVAVTAPFWLINGSSAITLSDAQMDTSAPVVIGRLQPDRDERNDCWRRRT